MDIEEYITKDAAVFTSILAIVRIHFPPMQRCLTQFSHLPLIIDPFISFSLTVMKRIQLNEIEIESFTPAYGNK